MCRGLYTFMSVEYHAYIDGEVVVSSPSLGYSSVLQQLVDRVAKVVGSRQDCADVGV